MVPDEALFLHQAQILTFHKLKAAIEIGSTQPFDAFQTPAKPAPFVPEVGVTAS